MPAIDQLRSARSIASCATSSASPRFCGPSKRSSAPCRRPVSWRKKFSTNCAAGAAGCDGTPGDDSSATRSLVRATNELGGGRGVRLPDLHPEMAAFRQSAYFDDEAVGQAGMPLRDRGRFVEIGHREHDVATDGFLRFRERTIDDALAARTGDDAGLELERSAIEGFASGSEVIIPGVPARNELLPLLR